MTTPETTSRQHGADDDATPVHAPAADAPDSTTAIVESKQSAGWLRRGDQVFVALLVVVAVVLMGVHWARLSGWGVEPVEVERPPERQLEFQLEINSATWVEWMQLEGIGDTLAHRIVDDREANGPFAGIEDIERVKGIGPKTVEKIRPWLRVDSQPADDESE